MALRRKKKSSRNKRCKERYFRQLAIINEARNEKRRLAEVKRLKAEKRKFIRANCLWSYDEEFDIEVGDKSYG